MKHTLLRTTTLPKPLEEAFRFFERPENLATITPASMRFVINTPSPIDMKKGTLIDYTLRMVGIPLHWRTEITAYDPPHFFADDQLKGPYKLWHHEHRFAEEKGQTVMTDTVTYDVGWGWLGELAWWLYVRHTLTAIFDYRAKAIQDLMTVNPETTSRPD